jgi:ABC-type multidrug transport system fused ATPase/permease subunit
MGLLMRMHDVTAGAIRIDSQEIRGVTQESLRGAIGLIPQDTNLFHRSLLENIRYGRPDATDEEVVEAARRAHAHEFIVELEQGYDTLVGERGIKISGGQRQRIAIARAILRNAPILLLDEATSALDSHSEQMIQQAMKEAMAGKTVIAIAHRLSTVMDMDRLIVLERRAVSTRSFGASSRVASIPSRARKRCSRGLRRTRVTPASPTFDPRPRPEC